MLFEIHLQSYMMVFLLDKALVLESGPVSKAALEKSGWLRHLKTILDGTRMIVKAVDEDEIHCLIHCRFWKINIVMDGIALLNYLHWPNYV
jgi:hypothetical protein